MKKGLTEIVMILDESGSMSSVKNDTIGGFNEFVDTQKKLEGEARLTLVKFSDYYNVVTDGEDINKVDHLNESTYKPTFSTALLDAVGKAINTVKNRIKETPTKEKPEKVIFVILTDGHENASQEFNQSKIIEMVKKERTKKRNPWEFIFLGADIDAWSGGSSMGISSTVNVDKSSMTRNFTNVSYYTANYRADSKDMSLDNFNLSEDESKEKLDGMTKNKK